MQLEELASRALSRPSERAAIEYDRRWYNWGDLRAVAKGLWKALELSGTHPDGPVILIPRNRPSALAALFALIAQGRTVRMVYAFQKPAGIAVDIARIEAGAVVAAKEDFTAEVLAALRAAGLVAIALSEMDAVAVEGFERCSNRTTAAQATRQIQILTSGTTGPPKHFVLPYQLIAQHLLGPNPIWAQPIEDYASLTPLLLFTPLANIGGIHSAVPALLKGQRIVLLDRFSAHSWRDFVLRYRPMFAGMVPAGVQMVLDANIPPADLAGIKAVGVGAAPLDPTVQRNFEERYGIPILQSYGATEFGGPVTAMTYELHAQWGSRKLGSVGRPIANTRLRVVAPDTGAELPAGVEGLLEVMTPRMGEHWIRTSDVAVIDADGFMFHRGRADGAIMRGGFKLLPETIESALQLHEAISAAAVTGIADKRLGEVPVAAIQLKPGTIAPSVTELEAHLRERLLATHIPVHWRFVDSLPRTPSLKVDRPALRKLFEMESRGRE